MLHAFEQIKLIDIDLTVAIVLPGDQIAENHRIVLTERIVSDAASLASFQIAEIHLTGTHVAVIFPHHPAALNTRAKLVANPGRDPEALAGNDVACLDLPGC